jgi:hypothetical protein
MAAQTAAPHAIRFVLNCAPENIVMNIISGWRTGGTKTAIWHAPAARVPAELALLSR